MRSAFMMMVVLAGSLVPAMGQNPYVQFSPPTLGLTTDSGSSSLVTAKVRMANLGNPFNFLATTNQGWLSVTPSSGSIGTGGLIEFTVTGDPTQILTGTYTGIVTVTPAQGTGLPPAAFSVTFEKTGLAFVSTPDRLDFTLGPENQETKAINVSLSDGSAREIAVTAFMQNGGNWLSVVTGPPINTPAGVNIRATSTGMDVGTVLQGEVRITAPSLPGVIKVIPATLTVQERPTGYTVVPSSMSFYQFSNQLAPAQPMQIVASGDRILPFDVLVSPGAAGLTTTTLRTLTPTTIGVQMDTTLTVELPRDDSLTIRPADGTGDVVIPVRTAANPTTVYAIPQVADGGAATGGKFRTSITVVNNDLSQTAIVSLRFYKVDPASHATVAWNPVIENNEKTDTVTIQPNASWTVQTAGAPDVISAGWGEVACSNCVGNHKGVSGLAVFRQLQPDGRIQEAAVPVNSSLMQRFQLPFDNTGGFVTSMAVANLSTTEVAKVRVAFRDGTGRIIRLDKVIDIPARGHYAFELPNAYTYLQGLRGTADFWATSGRVSVLGLRFSPQGAFTSFEAQSMNRRQLGRKSIPQVADGGEFRTSITLVNNDVAPANVRLRFWKSDGTAGATQPWTLAFQGGVNPDNLTIPSGTSVTIESAGSSGAVQQGWAEVITDQWVTGFAVFRQSVQGFAPQEAAVPVNTSTPNLQLLPFDCTGGFTTSIALANLSATQNATVNFTFLDTQGQRIQQGSVALPVQGHRAFRLVDNWPVLEGKRGTLVISQSETAGEITVLGLRFGSGGAFTSFKAQAVQ